MNVNASITHGYVYSNSPLTGGEQLQALTANDSVSTSKALMNLTRPAGARASGGAAGLEPQELKLILPEFRLEFVSRTSGSVGGRPWSGTFTFSLTGALYLEGTINCPSHCGTFGRCVAANPPNNTVAATAAAAAVAPQYSCECECGFSADPTTGRCDVPNGYCPMFPGSGSSASTGSIVQATNTGKSNAGTKCSVSTLGVDAVAAVAGTCPPKYGFDVSAKVCTRCAEEGWGGPGCKLCQTDEACRAKLGKSKAVCNTGLLYNECSAEKHYSCQLTDQSVARIVGPVLPLHCTTVNDASKNSTSQCSIIMRLPGMPQGMYAQCTATECHFAVGEPSFRCDSVVCGCPEGCPTMYEKTFKDVKGAVTLDCDATGAACTIVVGSLSMKMKASCEASECLDPSGPKLVKGHR